MVIAIQTQSVDSSNSSFKSSIMKVSRQLTSPFLRLWWHIRAYSGIFGIMVLAVLSVLVLYVYDKFSKTLFTIRQELHPSLIE